MKASCAFLYLILMSHFSIGFKYPLFKVSKRSGGLSLPMSSTSTNYKNLYFGLRHGESEANVAGVISSDPTVGSMIHGLTATGRKQSSDSAQSMINQLESVGILASCNSIEEFHSKVIFFSSNFTRARQTAEECLRSLQILLTLKYSKFPEGGQSFGGQDVCGSNYNLDPFKKQDEPDTWEEMKSRIEVMEKCSRNYQIRNDLRERYFGTYDAKDLSYYTKVWPLDMQNAGNTDAGVESVFQVIERLKVFLSEIESKYSDKVIIVTSHADTLQIMQTHMCLADVRMFSQYRFKNGEVRNMFNLPPPVSLQK